MVGYYGSLSSRSGRETRSGSIWIIHFSSCLRIWGSPFLLSRSQRWNAGWTRARAGSRSFRGCRCNCGRILRRGRTRRRHDKFAGRKGMGRQSDKSSALSVAVSEGNRWGNRMYFRLPARTFGEALSLAWKGGPVPEPPATCHWRRGAVLGLTANVPEVWDRVRRLQFSPSRLRDLKSAASLARLEPPIRAWAQWQCSGGGRRLEVF